MFTCLTQQYQFTVSSVYLIITAVTLTVQASKSCKALGLIFAKLKLFPFGFSQNLKQKCLQNE
jgi:hypothetical protein